MVEVPRLSKEQVPTRWDYDILKINLTRITLLGQEVSETDLPEEIDFDELVVKLRSLLGFTEGAPDKNEYMRCAGIEKEYPHSFRFSDVQPGSKYGVGAVRAIFPNEVQSEIIALPVSLHSHSIRTIFSLTDLFPMRTDHKLCPLIGVGIPAVGRGQKPLFLFAFRTNRTPILEDEIPKPSDADTQKYMNNLIKEIPLLFAIENDAILSNFENPTEQQIARLNNLYYSFHRLNAASNGIVFYAGELGQTVGKKFDFFLPSLDEDLRILYKKDWWNKD